MKIIAATLILVALSQLPGWAQDGSFNLMFPGLAIREWLNIPKPPGAVFVFCIVVCMLASLCFPRLIVESCLAVKQNFWRSLAKGLLVTLALGLLGKALSFVSIASPLAYLIFGIFQLSILAGLTVSVRLIGQSVWNSLEKMLPSLPMKSAKHPWITMFLHTLSGSVFIAAICLIPGPGNLPLIGTRLVILMCLLGLGGLVTALKARGQN